MRPRPVGRVHAHKWSEELLVHSNHDRRVVPRTDAELPSTVPASPGALVVGRLLPEHEFPTSDTQYDRKLVFRRRTVGEPESTVPATQLVLAVGGMAVDDVPVTVLDALEEDFESTVATSPVVRPGISDEVAPTLPAASDQLRAIRVVTMDEGDTDTLVSADSRHGHDTEAALEVRDPELRDDDESHAPGDSSVDTESMDGREESVMGPEDHVPHVEGRIWSCHCLEEQQSGMR